MLMKFSENFQYQNKNPFPSSFDKLVPLHGNNFDIAVARSLWIVLTVFGET